MKKKKVFLVIGSLIIALISAVTVLLLLMINNNAVFVNSALESLQRITSSQTESTQSTTATDVGDTTQHVITESTTSETTTITENPSLNNDILMLVNYENTISKYYVPELKTLSNGMQVDSRIYDDLNDMIEDAEAAGYNPVITSAYRSYDYQQKLYDRKIDQYISYGYSRKEAEKRAGEWVAKPGASEHQTGLAVDLTSKENQKLDDSQLKSKCQQWYMANCWKYGFILRYPSDKKDITKINSEPWHYRYVGKEAAKEIYEEKICLEEYLGQA